MEFILDIVSEFFTEGAEEVVKSKKAAKWVKVFIVSVSTLIYAVLVVLFALIFLQSDGMIERVFSAALVLLLLALIIRDLCRLRKGI